MDAIGFLADPLAGTPPLRDIVGEFAYKHKIPFGGPPSMGEYGTLFGLSTDNIDVGRQAALLADKILQGVPTGTTPVVSADEVLIINLKGAKRMGATIPKGLLELAAHVIQ